MKRILGRGHPLTVAALVLACLFTTTGLTGAASPAAVPGHSVTQANVAAADRYVSFAYYPGNFAGWHAWASSGYEAQNLALDNCNRYQSQGHYNCLSAGYAHNAYLAVAVSRPYGPWGYKASTSATLAGQWALYYCKYYGGGNDCRVIFNRSSSEG
jgi:Domain of unknown function (DUF4189)